MFKIDDAHADPVACVRMTPNEKYMVSTSRDDTIKVWDFRQRKLLFTFEHDLFKLGSNNTKLCVSPNNEIVVCGSKMGNMIYYNIKTGEIQNIVQN